MQKEETKFQNSLVFEGMTSIRSIIKGNDLGVNDRQIHNILFDVQKTSKIKKELGYLRAVSEKYGFSVIESNAEEIEKLTLGNTHGGLIAIAGERNIPKLTPDSNIESNGFYCMIQGIEDPYNFGYSLRSLYACGCSGIILSERNWMSAAGVVARSSAGASEMFNLFTCDAICAAKHFHDKGYNVVCADLNTDKVLGECEIKFPVLLIVGGEKRGISKSLLDIADTVVKIEYARNLNTSLSAASAATMFAYEIMRQNR